ncbi:MAG: DUF4469 domain-containing protein [Clostridiales bacterium]|jgi:hypothetical protein|nr:DUF4469 domain-containing protein [Clostridiales bacterium]
MAIKKIDDVLHRIRVKLYPNYLPNMEGRYIAKTDNEASLSIERICAAMKNRGGFMGSYDNLIDNVRQFMDECAYQLCDGYALNMGYYSIHPNICGTLDSEKDAHDPVKNPINFKYRTRLPLRKLVQHIAVEITGVANNKAYIDEYIDREEDSTNGVFTPGNMFCISGNKIKVAGDDPECGVYFVPVDDPSKAVKVTRVGENGSSMITGIAPITNFPQNRIEIRTQYTGSNVTFLKAPRAIVSDFILEEA